MKRKYATSNGYRIPCTSESTRIPIPANNNTIIQAFGSIVTGSTGGTLNFQWAQMTSNANATKVKQCSFMSISEVTE